VARKLKMLDVAARLDDLAVPPGNRLERLRGSQSDRHSIRVNDQPRVTFRWEQGHVYEVRPSTYAQGAPSQVEGRVENYH
jgi:toxin HigB-1